MAEAAALDPETTANDLVRLDNAACRARRDMAAVLEAAKAKPASHDALREYLASKQAALA